MSDVKCVVCNEPWDYYGARHGDMEQWEYELFRKGSGCPCCKGISSGKYFEPKTISDIEFGDEDPILRLNAWEDSIEGKAPKWEKPEPKVFWECEGCGVQVIGDPSFAEDHEDYLQYYLPINAKATQWYHPHPFWNGTPEKEPAHIFEADRKVCEFCLDHCDRCNKEICSTLEYGDTYDDGQSFPNPNSYYSSICVDCIETTCSECECFPEDCTCEEEEKNNA